MWSSLQRSSRPGVARRACLAAAVLFGVGAVLMARDAAGLEFARSLGAAPRVAARVVKPGAVQRLPLKLDYELRSRKNDSHASAATFFRGIGLGDALGWLAIRSPPGLLLHGAALAMRRSASAGARDAAMAALDTNDAKLDAVGAAAPAEDGGLFRGVELTLGPLRWRGNLTSEYRLQTAPGQRSSGFVESGNLQAASYVFQPWFAQLSGGLGFVRSKASGGGGAGSSSSTSLTGDANLSLFPASRFPFEASFSVSDSRASGEITGADFRTTRFGLRQSYHTLDGTRYSARYERSALSGATFGDDVLNVVEGNMSGRRDAQSYELNGNWSGNSGGVSGTQSNLLRLIGRHNYAPAANLNVETLATFNRSEFEQNAASLRNAFSNRFVQLASFASWRPEEGDPFFDQDHPMFVTGGLRFAGIMSESAGVASDIQSLSASAGLNYTINPITRLSANASMTQTGGTSGPRGLSSTQSAALTYAPTPLPLGDYIYSWNLSGSASNAGGGGQPGRQNLGGQGNHNLSRSFALAERSRLTLSLGQSAGATFATGGSGQSLTHNAAATWSLLGDSAAQSYVSLNASDSRTFGTTRGEFQLVNLQATRQAPLSTVSFWTANLTVQGSRQRSEPPAGGVPTATGSGFIFTTSGSVSYQHLRAFGVPRLRLFASYTANQAQLQSRTLGDINAPRETISDALEARLDYQIGKLDARLTFRSATVDRRRNTLLFLRLQRNF